MATVRFSGVLQEKIVKNAEALYAKRWSEVEKAPAGLAERIINDYVEENNARDAWNKAVAMEWTPRSSGIRFHILGSNSKPYNVDNGSTYIPVPQVAQTYGGNGIGLTASAPAVQEFLNWETKRQAVIDGRQAFKNKVSKFLSRHTTLRQALTEWSGLWELLPQDIKDKHNSTEDRTKNASTKEEFSVDDLTLTVVKSKMVESAI